MGSCMPRKAVGGLFVLILAFGSDLARAANLEELTVLQVEPAEDFVVSGPVGGPLNPMVKQYTLTNTGDSPLFWGAQVDADWVSFEPEWGSILPGGSASLALQLPNRINQWPVGQYTATLTLMDITHEQTATLDVAVSVTASPGVLEVTPGPFVAQGTVGGSFQGDAKGYTLANSGLSPLTWTIGPLPEWLSMEGQPGVLGPSESTGVMIELTEQAYRLDVGTYEAQIVFTVLETGQTVTRSARLTIYGPLERWVQRFGNSNFDLAHSTLHFRPDGSPDYYAVCREPYVQQFPVDPADGTPTPIWDDYAAEIILADGATVSFFGRTYDRVFVGSNGYITFGTPDTAAVSTWNNHFALPRIAAFFVDLAPVGPDHVSYKQLPDRLVVTYRDMRLSANREKRNDFQVAISLLDGSIDITWLQCDTNDEIIVGLSRGYADLTTHDPSDLSALAACCPCGDLTADTFVGLEDLVTLAGHWLANDCLPPDWCGLSDFDRNGRVGLSDLGLLSAQWAVGRYDWSPPVLLEELNDGDRFAMAPALTADERLIVFARRDPASGYVRLFEATRENPDGPFTGERRLDELVSTGYNVNAPWISTDGLRLYYWEKDAPPLGLGRIKLAVRDDRSQPWQYVRTLTELDPDGEGANNPALTEDELILVFSSYRPGSTYGTERTNLWIATRESLDEPFTNLRPLDELNSSKHEQGGWLSADGLILYFDSNRDSIGEDLFVAVRSSREEPFGDVQEISLSSYENKERQPWVTNGGRRLYFGLDDFGTKPAGIWLSRSQPVALECLLR